MAEENDETPVADENPYRSPRTNSAEGETPGDEVKQRNSGCAVLFQLGYGGFDLSERSAA